MKVCTKKKQLAIGPRIANSLLLVGDLVLHSLATLLINKGMEVYDLIGP